MSDKIKVAVLLITIASEGNGIGNVQNRMATTCFEHELPILEALHGVGRINVEDDAYDVVEIEDDAEAEYRRLLEKFNDKKTQIISTMFRGPAGLAGVAGLRLQGNGLMRAPEKVQAMAEESGDRANRVKELKEGSGKKGGKKGAAAA